MESSATNEARSSQDVSVYRRLILDTRLPHGAFRLWHYLRDRINKAGVSRTAVHTIRRELGVNGEALDGWETTLVKCGYLQFTKEGRSHQKVYLPMGGDGAGPLPEWVKLRMTKTGQTKPVSDDRFITSDDRFRAVGCPEPVSEVSTVSKSTSKGKAPPESLSEAARIGFERALERVETRLDEISNRAGEDAFGKLYSPQEKTERSALKAEAKRLKEKLGWRV